MTDYQQPHRPPIRGLQHYNILKQEITQRPNRKDLFTMTINASTQQKGENMDNQLNGVEERQFLIDLIFKPNEPGLRLRPAETQLLLAYMGEILKEIEEEEKLIIEEEKAAKEKENMSCK